MSAQGEIQMSLYRRDARRAKRRAAYSETSVRSAPGVLSQSILR